MSRERMDQLIDEAEELEPSLTQVALYEEAIRIADELEDEWNSFHLRKELMQAAVFSGASEKLLTAFSWCLGKSDQNPDMFPDIELLWQYKWAIAHAYRFPQISLEQIRAMLDDLERRLSENDLSTRPASYLRMCFCASVGLLDEAAEHAGKWTKQERDYLADCEACELDNHIDMLVALKHDELAEQTAKPIVDLEVTCAEVPHRTYAKLMMAAVRRGDEELARRYHRTGLPMVLGNTDFLPQVAQHAVYLTRNGEQAKALPVVERSLAWSLETLEPLDQLEFFAGVLAVLQGDDSKSVTLRLPSTHPLAVKGDHQYSRRELVDWFRDEVEQLCGQFNQRNQNQWQTVQVADLLELAKP